MADEQDLPAGADDEEVVTEQIDEQDDQQDDPVASLAREMGWAPKDEFRGDPEKWKPADEFIRTGRDIQRGLTDRLKSMEDQVGRMGRVAEQLASDKAAERDAYWQQQLDKAVDEGDHEAARKATEELRKANETSKTDGPPPESQAWISRNPWFNSDPLAQARAMEVTERLARQGYGVAEQLEQAERAVRKEFPEHFKQAKDPPATQTGQSRKATPTNRKKGFADMPSDSQKMARDMADRNPGLSLEAIAQSYWADVAQQTKRA